MKNALLHWILSAFAIWIVSEIVPGFIVEGAGSALFAALVIGLVNGTIGFFLKVITLPLTFLTFGLFLLVINAFMLMVSDILVPGFEITSFGAALIGAGEAERFTELFHRITENPEVESAINVSLTILVAALIARKTPQISAEGLDISR